MNPVEAWQSTAAETRLQKEKIIPSTISPKCQDTEDLIRKINRETRKQIKIFHVGKRLFPGKEFSVEIPTLLEVRNQKSAPKVCPLKDIFRDFESGVIHFGGPAGSGKTTLLKEISRRVYEKEFESLLGVEVVLFLRCADMNTQKKTSPAKLLLSHLEPEPTYEEMQLFHSLLNNTPGKVLFLLDGLDTLPEYFFFNSTKQSKCLDIELQRVYTIITDLLSGRLYKDCRIITSARDLDLQHLRVSPRSHVRLMGLQNESIFKISREYLDLTDVNTMMTMLHGQQELMDLCRTPMFLIAVLISRKMDDHFRNISSITDSLLHLMNEFIEAQESLMEVTDKVNLKRLAFDLLEHNQLNFSEKTLNENGLNSKSIESLIFYSPNGLNRVVFFVHQFIHEALAALHLVGLKEKSFKEKLKKCIELQSFSFAILMVCRILCSDGTQNLAKKDDLLQLDGGLINKRNILLGLLRNRLVNFPDRGIGISDLLTLLALHECGKFAIPINEELNHIHLRSSPFVQLSISHLFAVMSVATKSKKLNTLALQRCGLNSFHLKVIRRIIDATPVQIDNLNLSFNDNLNAEAMGLVGDITRLCNARELNVSGCSCLSWDSPDTALFNLKKTLKYHKLEVLDASYNMQCLSESEMTENTMKKTTHVSYKRAVDRHDPGDPLPETITANYTLNGKWNEASYDFVRSVLKLTESVTKRIVLRCWKFSKERQDMMRNCPNACPGLELVLYDNGILTPKPVSGGVFKSESSEHTPTSDLKNEMDRSIDSKPYTEPPEKILKTWTDQSDASNDSGSERIEKMDSDDERVLGEKGTFHESILLEPDEVEKVSGVCHRAMTEEDVKNIVNDLDLKKSHVYELEFRQCHLKENLVVMLLNEIRRLKSRVKKLNVTAHDGIEKLLPVICELMKECGSTELNLEESTGSDDILLILNQHIEQHKVNLQKLDLSYTENINFEQLGTIISNGLTGLSLVNCHLQPKDFAAMQVENSKLQYLDISYNEIDEECIELLAGLLCKDKPVTLVMKGCDFTADEISAFESIGNIKVGNIDLSYNADLEPEGLEEIGRFVRKHNTKEVRLSACKLDGDSLSSLRKGLENHELHTLDLSKNPGISSCHKRVTDILHDSRVKEFNLSNCKMLSMQIKNLSKELRKQSPPVKTIDLSGSERRRIDQEYGDSIRTFLPYPECQQLKLFLPHFRDKKTLRNLLLLS